MRPACDCCEVARGFADYRMFDPACLWCGARYWRNVADSPHLTTDELAQRRAGIEATWTRYGHDRRRLVELAEAGPVPYEPVRGRRKAG